MCIQCSPSPYTYIWTVPDQNVRAMCLFLSGRGASFVSPPRCCFRWFNSKQKRFSFVDTSDWAPCAYRTDPTVHYSTHSRGIHIGRWHVSSENVIHIKKLYDYMYVYLSDESIHIHFHNWLDTREMERTIYNTLSSHTFNILHFRLLFFHCVSLRHSFIFDDLFFFCRAIFFPLCFSLPISQCDYRPEKKRKEKRKRDDCFCHSTRRY